LRRMEVCVFYVCGHFICTDCFRRLIAVDPPGDSNGNRGFHLCPMCRTPILREAGTWVAHTKEMREPLDGCTGSGAQQQTFFFNTKTGETGSEPPAGSERYWNMVKQEGGDV
jgi:hypothetical protein